MVSVVIPTYGRPEKVLNAISSVQRQVYNNIEILIIDDNGIGTSNQIDTERTVNSIIDNRVRYIKHEKNRGGCAARNTGIKSARGEYVAFLDDDDVWSERFVEAMLPHLDNERIGAVYCDFYSYNGLYTITTKESKGFEGNVYKNILSGWCPASTSLFVVRRDSIVKAGMFDEELRSFQDYDMWLRLSRICDFAFCKEKLVLKYEGFGEQTSRNPARREAGYKRVVEKYSASLPEDEKSLFSKFVEEYYYDTLYRKIIYNKKHDNEYKSDLKEYLDKYNSIKNKLHIFFKMHLSEKAYSALGIIYIKHSSGMIIYKGKYPI